MIVPEGWIHAIGASSTCLRRNDDSKGGNGGQGRVGVEGPGRFVQEVGDACTDVGCPPLGTVYISVDSATAPYFRGDVDETREILALGQPRPPEVLYHPEGWERRPVTAVRSRKLSGCDDGGILAPYFRGDVDETRDILALGQSRSTGSALPP